jgi:hypothetical protein
LNFRGFSVCVEKIHFFFALSTQVLYSLRMTRSSPGLPPFARASYAALRQGGAPPPLAQVQLGLHASDAERLERLFRARGGGGGDDAMRPAFARHEEHVSAVLAAGGYPALPETRR